MSERSEDFASEAILSNVSEYLKFRTDLMAQNFDNRLSLLDKLYMNYH